MNRSVLSAVALCIGLSAVGSVVLPGCGKKEEPVSKEEQANWKGGPMPADFAREMAQKDREAQQKAQQQTPR